MVAGSTGGLEEGVAGARHLLEHVERHHHVVQSVYFAARLHVVVRQLNPVQPVQQVYQHHAIYIRATNTHTHTHTQ